MIQTANYTQLGNSFAFAELNFEFENIVYTQNYLSQYASQVIKGWENRTQTLASNLFSSPANTFPMINKGFMFQDLPPNQTETAVGEVLTAALFANILVSAWSGGASIGQPVFL